MEFFERLKEVREKSGISSKDMAKRIGVAPSTYSQYENGRREPDVFKINKISRALNISADYLLFGNDNNVNESFYEDEGIELYNSLDEIDKAEIRGTMKQMLKADKYIKEETNKLLGA